MLLSCDDEPNLCYCTRVVQFQKATQWTSVESLLANTTAHILTILEVPCFKNTMVEISATITCKVESDTAKELQLHVPPFQLKVQDAVNNWNTTFTSHEDPEDVLSVLAASEKVTLTARWQRPELQLEKILAMNMHFDDYVGLGCFYNSGKETPGLAGLMVEIAHRAGSDFIINVYSRNTQQLYLFVSMFYDAVPLDTVAFLLADDRRVDCDRLREAFREELVLVRGLLPDDAMACDSDDVVVGCEKYASFREHFSHLELTTDMLASGNHQPIA
ncbi:uncharacterized protein LOC134542357 isoform X3 [Bacillus rossius redtenbacheri]